MSVTVLRCEQIQDCAQRTACRAIGIASERTPDHVRGRTVLQRDRGNDRGVARDSFDPAADPAGDIEEDFARSAIVEKAKTRGVAVAAVLEVDRDMRVPLS